MFPFALSDFAVTINCSWFKEYSNSLGPSSSKKNSLFKRPFLMLRPLIRMELERLVEGLGEVGDGDIPAIDPKVF